MSRDDATEPLTRTNSAVGEEIAASGPVEAVVFDCDGVIADTVALWNETFSTVASRHGIDLRTDHDAELHGSAIGPASDLMASWTGGG